MNGTRTTDASVPKAAANAKAVAAARSLQARRPGERRAAWLLRAALVVLAVHVVSIGYVDHFHRYVRLSADEVWYHFLAIRPSHPVGWQHYERMHAALLQAAPAIRESYEDGGVTTGHLDDALHYFGMEPKHRNEYPLPNVIWWATGALVRSVSGDEVNAATFPTILARSVLTMFVASALVSVLLLLLLTLTARERWWMLSVLLAYSVAVVAREHWPIQWSWDWQVRELPGATLFVEALLGQRDDYLVFGPSARSNFLLVMPLFFLFRWQGCHRAAYAVAALLTVLHTAQAGLLAIAFVAVDLCLRPRIFRNWLVLLGAAVPIGVFIMRWVVLLGGTGAATVAWAVMLGAVGWVALLGRTANTGVDAQREQAAAVSGSSTQRRPWHAQLLHGDVVILTLVTIAGVPLAALALRAGWLSGGAVFPVSIAMQRWGSMLPSILLLYAAVLLVHAARTGITRLAARATMAARVRSAIVVGILALVWVVTASARIDWSGLAREKVRAMTDSARHHAALIEQPVEFRINNGRHVMWYAVSLATFTGRDYTDVLFPTGSGQGRASPGRSPRERHQDSRGEQRPPQDR